MDKIDIFETHETYVELVFRSPNDSVSQIRLENAEIMRLADLIHNLPFYRED